MQTMTIPADIARCANARRCALDGVCLRSSGPRRRETPTGWYTEQVNYIAPPPATRPSPHLCGWYLEER